MKIILEGGAELTPTAKQAKQITNIFFGVSETPKAEVVRTVKKRKPKFAYRDWTPEEDAVIKNTTWLNNGVFTFKDAREVGRVVNRTTEAVYQRYQTKHKVKNV